ncbi:uncharacterized protein ACRADG_004761 isoform 2-T2 [Cochliomyia hominivorax]
MSKRARDAEEVKKRKMARLRFRNIIRSVSINRIWLEDAGEQKFSLNVKKNIAMLVRPKRKIGILTMAEKSLIRTHHTLRTTEDRKKLVTLMANLNCFNNFPPKIRARLSKCVKFMVLNAGRKLIQEGNLPLMLYFVLTGEVEVSKRIFDHVQNSYINKTVKVCGPGDCLGDVEMLEKGNRMYTYTTTNVVELLVVFDVDFELILRAVMEPQWVQRKISIMALDYFKFFTNDQIINTCKLCMLRQFEPLETIYHEDKGDLSYVYFVISGECMILQCLKMMVRQRRGIKTFELIDTTKEASDSIFQYFSDNKMSKILKMNTVNKFGANIDFDNETHERPSKDFDDVKDKIENRFIDVGSLTFGGIFGLGEKFEHRVIMARTTVQCLMIPRYWLLEQEQNPGNIWQRRRFYLDTTIPSRETLFKDFLNTRQWHNFKMNIIQSYLNKNSIANLTHVEDIPIICRIVEARDE